MNQSLVGIDDQGVVSGSLGFNLVAAQSFDIQTLDGERSYRPRWAMSESAAGTHWDLMRAEDPSSRSKSQA